LSVKTPSIYTHTVTYSHSIYWSTNIYGFHAIKSQKVKVQLCTEKTGATFSSAFG